jgi:hypothetical protein
LRTKNLLLVLNAQSLTTAEAIVREPTNQNLVSKKNSKSHNVIGFSESRSEVLCGYLFRLVCFSELEKVV